MYQNWFINYNKYTQLMKDVSDGKLGVGHMETQY